METTTEAYEAFDAFLDEFYGTVTVCGLTYDSSRAILELDPVAYRCGFNDWADAYDIDIDSLEGSLHRH